MTSTVLNKFGVIVICIEFKQTIGILLNKDFEFDVLEIKKDKEGNMLSLLISIDTIKINLITLYGPNNDDPSK